MINEMMKTLLTNAYVDELYYIDENTTLQSISGYRLYETDNGFKVEIGGNRNEICNEFNYGDLESSKAVFDYYSTIIRNGNKTEFANGTTSISFVGSRRAIPFADVNINENTTPLIGDNKKECTVLKIEAYSKVIIGQYKDDNKGLISEKSNIYSNEIYIGIDTNTYLYIIQLENGTLPIILISKEKINSESILDNILRSTNSEEKFYNSYAHPYRFEIRDSVIYNNAVFGVPGSNKPSHE